MKFPYSPIASAVALCFLGSALPTLAADAKPADAVIEVTGIRASKQKSLTAKKQSNAVVEVVTAEDIGKMPDKNVADSLQRVPGVNTITAGGTEGGFGENDRISLRGTPPSLALTNINGHGVGTGDWFVLNQGASGRSVSYSLLPSELVDRVVINKSSQADLVEGGVSGSVDIQTRHPLDVKDRLSGLASVSYAYSTLSEKWNPQLSGMINWKNESNTFGVMVQLFNEKRDIRRDGQEFLWWDTVESQAGDDSEIFKSRPDLRGKAVSLLTGSALFEQQRERNGGLVSVQFKPSASVNLEATYFNSELKASNYNRNMMFWPGSPLSMGVAPSGATVNNGTVTSLTLPATCHGDCGSSWEHDAIARPGAKAQSEFFSFDGKFRLSDSFVLTSKLGSTRGEGATPRDIGFEINGPYTGGSYVLHGLDSPADINVPGADQQIVGGDGKIGGWGSATKSIDKESFAQADGEWRLDHDVFESIKFGLRYSKHERTLESIQLQTLAAGTNPANAPRANGARYPANFGSDLGGGVLKNSWQVSMDDVVAWSNKYQCFGTVNADTQTCDTSAPIHNESSEFKISEPVTAAYVMANFASQGVQGNVGVRLVKTKEEVTKYTRDAGIIKSNLISNNYTDVLPSANVKLELAKDLMGRIAIAKTMSRPDFGALGQLSLDDLTLSGSGGNPNLKPVRSTNFDASVEWYYAPKSLASIGYYYMDLSSYISYGSYTQSFLNQNLTSKAGSPVYSVYTLSAAQNTTGKVQGLELNVEQPIAYGFGFNANYTYASGKETSSSCRNAESAGDSHACDLLGTSKHTFNLGGYYEQNGLSARIAYNYRSAMLNGLDRHSAIYQDEVGTVMASIAYNLTDNIVLTLDGKDLNNPVLKSFVYDKTGSKQPQAFYTNGRQYYLGVRMKF